MKFNKEFFESHGGSKETGSEKISEFLEKLSSGLKTEGIPVGKDCRISMDGYSEIYSDIEKDKKTLAEYNKEWHPSLFSEKRMGEERLGTSGEQLEILITALFSKFIGEDYIVARASEFDDVINGIDNIVLSRKTGNLICAFDEVADISHKDYETKVGTIMDKNKKGGSKLKYGIKIEDGKISLGNNKGAPIFYLALPQHLVSEGIKNFKLSLEEKSDYEKKLFKYFMSSIYQQYRLLKLETNLTLDLRKKLEDFRQVIEKFSEILDQG